MHCFITRRNQEEQWLEKLAGSPDSKLIRNISCRRDLAVTGKTMFYFN